MNEINKEKRVIKAFNSMTQLVSSSIMKFKGDESIGKLELKILYNLSKEKEFNMSELAKLLNVVMSAVTGTADRLIKKDLVIRERDQDDRRIVRIRLTEKGKNIAKAYGLQQIELIKNVMMILSSKEQDEFIRLLEKITNSLKEEKK